MIKHYGCIYVRHYPGLSEQCEYDLLDDVKSNDLNKNQNDE